MTTDEGWEARMAARAAARRVERPQDFWNWDAVLWYRKRHAEALAYICSTQTLGDAVDQLTYDGPIAGCACPGDPCCKDWWANAQQLHRAAHITARLLSDAINKGERSHGV